MQLCKWKLANQTQKKKKNENKEAAFIVQLAQTDPP